MSRIYINTRQTEESRIIVVDDNNNLIAFEQELVGQENIKGDLYKGVVSKVEGSLEAVFVDLGIGKNGFLPFREVSPVYGNLSPGDSVLVQIKKDHAGSKGAGLTTYVSLAGSYLVLNTQRAGRANISKRGDTQTRAKIHDSLKQLELPEGMSVIVRTSGLTATLPELQWDLNSYLLKLWSSIEEAAANERGPVLIYRENNLLLRTMRDYFRSDIKNIICDNPDSYRELRQYASLVFPQDLDKVMYHDSDDYMLPDGVEEQISGVFQREINTPLGARLFFDSTEAMVAVDVNSASLRRGGDIEETALKANLEATEIIARQLRLRDLAGLIVVDFIDMEEEKNRVRVEKTFVTHLNKDRAKIRYTNISSLGLMELSRQRLSRSLEESHGIACVHCGGTGRVRRSESFALQLLRRLRVAGRNAAGEVLLMQAPESAAIYLLNEKRVELRRLEDENDCNIFILPDKDMHPSDCQISTLKGAARDENSYSLPAKTAGDKAEKWRNRLTAEHRIAQPLVKTVMPEARAPGGGLRGKLKRLWNKWLTLEETEEKKTSPPSADNNRKRGMNRGRSNRRAEGSEHAPERKHKSPEDAPTRKRQRGGGRNAEDGRRNVEGGGCNAEDRAEKPAATNRRPRIRPSSTLKRKPPEEASAAPVSPVAQTSSTPLVADTPPSVETVESPGKIPVASVSPVAQTPPKPPFADTPPPLTTMQMVESSAESNLPQEEYKEIMLDGTYSVVAKSAHAAANTLAMQQVETAGKRDGA